MAVDVVIHDLTDCSELEAYVAQRLETVVGRFACRVSGATVHLREGNGDNGDIHRICDIDVRLIPRGEIHVSARHESSHSAALNAIRRIETAVAKAVDRCYPSPTACHSPGGSS